VQINSCLNNKRLLLIIETQVNRISQRKAKRYSIALLNAIKLLENAFKCMKRRTRRTYPAEPSQESRGLSSVADRKRAGSTSRLDIFTRTTITGLSFLKRSLKAFRPKEEKVTLQCDRDLKRILIRYGNALRFLLCLISHCVHIICLCCKYSVYKLRKAAPVCDASFMI